MSWSQQYVPLGDSIALSALVAALPVATLLALLAFRHVRAHLAALAGLLVAAAIAVGVYGMPVPLALASAGYGAAFGLFPIGWIVINAIFIYTISVDSGGFTVLQDRMSSLSHDRRALSVLFPLAGLVGCGVDRERHVLQRAVRQSADSHRPAAGPLAHPHGCRQQLRRRHGQDD
jgi:lactate permease